MVSMYLSIFYSVHESTVYCYVYCYLVYNYVIVLWFCGLPQEKEVDSATGFDPQDTVANEKLAL